MIVSNKSLRNDHITPAFRILASVFLLVMNRKSYWEQVVAHANGHCHGCNAEVVGSGLNGNFAHVPNVIIGVSAHTVHLLFSEISSPGFSIEVLRKNTSRFL